MNFDDLIFGISLSKTLFDVLLLLTRNEKIKSHLEISRYYNVLWIDS